MRIYTDSLEHMLSMLDPSYLITLNLSHNSIDDESCDVITRKLATSPIKTLNLSYNQISNEGACFLFEEWLINYTDVLEISLRGNQLDDDAVMTIVGLLNGNPALKLKLVDMRDNRVSLEGMHMLRQCGALDCRTDLRILL